MKCNISGPRDMTDKDTLSLIEKLVEDSGFEITEILSTCETGVDMWARNWANANNVPVKDYKADWNNTKGVPKENIKKNKWGKKYNSKAGVLRDDMVMGNADCAIIIDDGNYSKEYLAKRYEIPIHVHRIHEENKEYKYEF